MVLSVDSTHKVQLDVFGHEVATRYYDEGTGPVVLLIHGSGPGVSAAANWGRHTLPGLVTRFRVIAPDMAGFGRSIAPETLELNPAAWVEQLSQLLNALDIERCSTVGNSFGGALSMRLGLRSPARVERQVLMGPVGTHFALTPALDDAWGYADSTEAGMRAQLRDFVSDPSLVTDALVATRHEAAMAPGILAAYARMFPAPRQRWIEALALTEEQLRSVPQETLIIHGREDRIIPLDSSERMVRFIPNAQLHVFGHCGHWVQIEQATRFNALVNDFLNE